MQTLLTSGNVTFGVFVIGTIFAVYLYFRNPQVDSDKRDALLAQQIEFFMKATADRFKEMQDSFNSLLLQSNNHIHTVDTKVEALTASMGVMSNQITRLATIIEERIPKA